MECLLEAQPLPDIKWFQGTKQINLTERVKMVKKDMGKDTFLLSLEISNPTIADGGNWRCNAVNAFGESNANITLNFQGSTQRPHGQAGRNAQDSPFQRLTGINPFQLSAILCCLLKIQKNSQS